MDRISVIAPVALTETLGAGSNKWREPVNEHARLRTRLMLRSFLRGFDPNAVENFVMVSPDRDLEAIGRLAADEHAGDRVAILAESDFFRNCGFDGLTQGTWGGWQIQQLIKLAFARVSPTDYYLTLDSDIVQFRSAGLPDLFPEGGKPLAGVESAADYDRLYTDEFSCKEQDAKNQYYGSSQLILGYDRPVNRSVTFFSETPVVLHKLAVAEMVRHIETRHRKNLAAVLSEHAGWSEYSLYFQFLEMTGALDEIYHRGDCNAVLSLEKSVWQPTACYRSQRFYDRQHFMSSPLVREGPFLAIQSWIRVPEWLPSKFPSAADFYEHLDSWLSSSSGPSLEPDASADRELDPVNKAAFLRILETVDPSSALFRRARQVLEGSLETGPRIPPATPPGQPKFLTIGMTTHDDYDGCYFTIQAIRLYHPEILDDVEILVVDNNPAGPCAKALKALENYAPNYRYIPLRSRQGTAVRDVIFREASGQFVLCIDCHVFFPPGTLAKLIDYCRRNPESRDLLQGPLISDAIEPMATHFEPEWSHGMYGQWGMDERGEDPGAPPFEIAMQGLGAFGCRREIWPGFNPRLSGFGGEEGYLHEKIRRAGGRNLCLPFLRWMHRFERPMGIPYKPNWGDRIRNYLLIYDELKLDPAPVAEHFEELLGKKEAQELVQTAHAEICGPFHFFDAIYCINLDRQADRWQEMQGRFRKLGIERAVRRFSAAETPWNHHIGCALSHRRIIAEARQQGLETILVFEDDARFTADAAAVLKKSLEELEGHEWQLFYLGGYVSKDSLQPVPDCPHLVIPGWITCTHAIAYHRSVFDAILSDVPENAVDVALWARTNLAIDNYYRASLQASSYLAWPIVATQSSILPQETREFEP